MKYGVKIGQDITIQQLRNNYDAVLITIGASADKKLGLEGENAEGVLSAVEFLREVGLESLPDMTGKNVVVIAAAMYLWMLFVRRSGWERRRSASSTAAPP